MSVSRVREIGELLGDQQQDLARVFINAFEDGGSKFPINFDSTWRFLQYSTKGSALRKLKSDFLEGEDYIVLRERVFKELHTNLQESDQGGRPTDKYFMTTIAFEHLSMGSPGERGKLVRKFFVALKKQYFRNLDGLGKRRRSENEYFLEAEKLAQELKVNSLGKERQVQEELSDREGGTMEVKCKYGAVDVLTEREVIEVKAVGQWKHALGQVLAYSACFPEHQARIHLYSDESSGAIELTGLCDVCTKVGVKVTLQ